jgi:hypothetical protein
MIGANLLQFTSYFTFSATAILYVYTIQRSSFSQATYHDYLTSAMRCQAQLSNLAENDSLLSRYCVVLEELRIEAQTQIDRQTGLGTSALNQHAANFLHQATQNPLENEIHFPEFGLGESMDFQMSPENGMPDLANWVHFEALVSPDLWRTASMFSMLLTAMIKAVPGFGDFLFDPTFPTA